ncbi:MAG: glycosyl hydrolase [Bacteroidota bacterium]
MFIKIAYLRVLRTACSITLCLIFITSIAIAQDSLNLSGLQWRSIGPAFMSGRIADVAINPSDDNHWYIGVGSGGVWETKNAGVTWNSIFDGQSSYSIGCVTIDERDPNRVWVGTGENVGGRHVGFGDGIYLSTDGGKSWSNKGLKASEHLSKIIVHPDNSNVLWVAAQGPLWTSGGERGVYKTTDGGASWTQVLGDDEWMGATDLLIDPRNPDVLYAATWERHRTIAAYMGGGPKTGIYRSDDGGDTWQQLKTGLPTGRLGKIGLAISPQQPDVIYAAIEEDRRTGGVYRSADRGATWQRRSDAVSGATGPHYYQELYACPHTFDRLYLMDVRIQVSDDGGKNFRRLKEEHKHSDNHGMAFRKDDPDYLLVATDGGLYESFDLADNWRFMANLPITQFYKIAVDDAEPFYNVYGGTQDNSTEGGPSRTDAVQGIRNSDWRVVLNWDGHQPATEPGNPNIVYGQRQQGTLSRIDMLTGEVIDIQPQPGADEPYERFNWDAPILVSSHQPSRIYFASQRLWRSDNRGDNWQALSSDLTKNEERLTLPIMGKQQSWDNAWDVSAMSNYNTITSIAESPKNENLLYIGTDDGIMQVTEDGGQNWRKISLSSIKGVPATCYVNDIKADLFDERTVYVALDNHKYGDYAPYLIKSTDAGKTWRAINSNLPERTLVWRIVQDHEKAGLLFVGTEFGVYCSVDGGANWNPLGGGFPTIPVRDLQIQRRENDLVAGTFGRSIYILDDYQALRSVSEEQMAAAGTLFPTRDAWWYIPRPVLGFDGTQGAQGAGYFRTDNPPFGAVFTYHLKEDIKSAKAKRQEAEKKAEGNIPFPGWDALAQEEYEIEPQVFLEIRNAAGEAIRRVNAPASKGFHRVAWDLRHPSSNAISSSGGWQRQGMLAVPGDYSATLYRVVAGQMEQLGETQPFTVKPLRQQTALPAADMADIADFWQDFEATYASSTQLSAEMQHASGLLERLEKAAARTQGATADVHQQLANLQAEANRIEQMVSGNPAKDQVGEKTNPTIFDHLFAVMRGIDNSTYGPTAMHQQSLDLAKTKITAAQAAVASWNTQAAALRSAILQAGGPWVRP